MKRFLSLLLAVTALVFAAQVVTASDADVAVVDITAPFDSVTLLPGGSENITINISVTGAQAGTATFKVYKDWTLTGGIFSGSNPEEFTVEPRAGGDPATTFSRSGTVTVAAGHASGSWTLAVGVFDITNSNTTGGKLEEGSSSSYEVTVLSPPADTTPPTITITTPAAGATYVLNQAVNANYSCADEVGGSGLASCVGTVANGAAIDTSSVGAKSFTVNAADNAGNQSSLTHNYTVVYDVCVLYDQTQVKKAGSTVPVRLQLCDSSGNNVSSASVIVTAVGVNMIYEYTPADEPEDSGNANPDSNFRYSADLQGYIFNLSTKGMTAGTWRLWFTVSGEPSGTYHSVQFVLK
jgi:hypothetical protein